MTTVKFEFSGDPSDVIASYKKAYDEQVRVTDSLREGTRVSAQQREENKRLKDVAREQAKAERELAKVRAEGQVVSEKLMTADERRAAELIKLNRLLEQGAITEQTHSRATAELERETREAAEAARLQALGFESSADAMRQAERIASQLRTAENELADELSRVNRLVEAGALSADDARRHMAKYRDELDRTGRSAEGAFSIGTHVAGYLASISTMQTATELLRETWETIRSEQDEAYASVEGQVDPNRRLLQISPSQGVYEERQQTADDLAIKYGIDPAEVRSAMFDAISGGVEEGFEQVARATPVIELGVATKTASQLPQLFPQQRDELETQEVLSATLLASQASLADFEQLAGALPTAAAGVGQLGGSLEETLASVAALTNKLKSPEQAADRIAAFASALAQESEFQGKGLIESVKILQQMEQSQQAFFAGNPGVDTAAVEAFRESASGIDAIEKKLQADSRYKDMSFVDALKEVGKLSEDKREKLIGSSADARLAYEAVTANLDQFGKFYSAIQGSAELASQDQDKADTRRGVGVSDAIREIDKVAGRQREILGDSKEMNEAFSLLTDSLGDISKLTGDISADMAAGGRTLEDRLAVAAADPVTAGMQENRRAAARLAVQKAEGEYRAEGVLDDLETAGLQASSTMSKTAESWLGLGEFFARSALEGGLSPESSSKIGAAARVLFGETIPDAILSAPIVDAVNVLTTKGGIRETADVIDRGVDVMDKMGVVPASRIPQLTPTVERMEEERKVRETFTQAASWLYNAAQTLVAASGNLGVASDGLSGAAAGVAWGGEMSAARANAAAAGMAAANSNNASGF